jgi:hypothetical protein
VEFVPLPPHRDVRAVRPPDDADRQSQRDREGDPGDWTTDRNRRHVHDVARLHAAFFALKKDAARGVNGETWRHYEATLETRLPTF